MATARTLDLRRIVNLDHLGRDIPHPVQPVYSLGLRLGITGVIYCQSATAIKQAWIARSVDQFCRRNFGYGERDLCHREELLYARLGSASSAKTKIAFYVELMDVTSRFRESCLLETHDVSTWKGSKEHARNLKAVWESIHRCEKKVQEIRTSIERIIEAEHQRELSQDIRTFHEIISSLTRRASAVNGRVGSATGSYESM
ncbi:hypothetical protein C8R45DRAFT_941263 [Mycena sanguinolenta]|nr:hypothetical protein C8R45DRAFT_941263 [Mycena sanguinolenta]